MQLFVEWRQFREVVTGYKSWYECVYDSIATASAMESIPHPDKEETLLSLKGLLVDNDYSLGRFLLRSLSTFPGMHFSLFSTLIIANSPTELNEVQRLVAKVETGASVIAFVENEGSLMSFVIKKRSDDAVLVVAMDRSRPYSVRHRAFIVLLANALLNPRVGTSGFDLADDLDLEQIAEAIHEKRVFCE